MEQKVTSHVVKGLIIALLLIIVNLAGHFAGLALENWYGWIGIVIFFAGIIWSVISYGKQMNNNVTFGNLFAHGFKVTAVTTCITFVYTLLAVYIIFPDFIDQVLQKGIEEARKQNKATDEQLEQGMEMARKITTIVIIAGSIIGSLIVGVIASLIGAAAAKKTPRDPFVQQTQM